jgi:hypothetical protein
VYVSKRRTFWGEVFSSCNSTEDLQTARAAGADLSWALLALKVLCDTMLVRSAVKELGWS